MTHRRTDTAESTGGRPKINNFCKC